MPESRCPVRALTTSAAEPAFSATFLSPTQSPAVLPQSQSPVYRASISTETYAQPVTVSTQTGLPAAVVQLPPPASQLTT